MIARSLALLLVGILTNSLAAQENPPERSSEDVTTELNNRIDELSQAYKERLVLLNKQFESATATATNKASEELTKMQKAVASSDLDRAVAIRDLVVKLKAEPIVLPELESATTEGNRKQQPLPGRSQGRAEKELAKRLKASVSNYSDLLSTLVGQTYRFGALKNAQTYTLQADGVVLVNGKPSQIRWLVYKNDAIVCVGTETHNIDLLVVSDDRKTCELRYIGDIEASSIRHPGVVLRKAASSLLASQAFTISSTSKGVSIGSLQKGEKVALQYVEGKWGFGGTMGKGVVSPDDPIRRQAAAVAVISPNGKIQEVPAGTAKKPYIYIAKENGVFLLRMRDSGREDNRGNVIYNVQPIN